MVSFPLRQRFLLLLFCWIHSLYALLRVWKIAIIRLILHCYPFNALSHSYPFLPLLYLQLTQPLLAHVEYLPLLLAAIAILLVFLQYMYKEPSQAFVTLFHLVFIFLSGFPIGSSDLSLLAGDGSGVIGGFVGSGGLREDEGGEEVRHGACNNILSFQSILFLKGNVRMSV